MLKKFIKFMEIKLQVSEVPQTPSKIYSEKVIPVQIISIPLKAKKRKKI